MLRGAGDVVRTKQDNFLEMPLPKFDTLFVIDNSVSMASFQANTATNLGRAFDLLASSDSQFAITTTDPANGGKLICGAASPKVISGSTGNAKAKFLQKFSQLAVTPDLPPVLDVVTAAISPALLAADNAGLMRPGALHSIVIVTDTDDHSTSPVSSYIPALAEYGMTVVARLFPTPGCTFVNLGAPRLVGAAAAAPFRGEVCRRVRPDVE